MNDQLRIGRVVGATVMALVAMPGIASAALVLDTGTPTTNAMAMPLDSTDFYAAELNIAAGSTVTSIEAYVVSTFGADAPGDSFTLGLYQDNSAGTAFLGNRYAAPLYTATGTYSADGWNGANGLNWTIATGGNYWVALELGASDTAVALTLPSPTSGGTAPASDYAFSSTGEGGYSDSGALPFGIQVNAIAPVPLPAGVWLLGSALLGCGSLMRRRRRVE